MDSKEKEEASSPEEESGFEIGSQPFVERLVSFWDPHLEHCGIVMKDGGVLEVPNVADHSYGEFAILTEDVLAVAEVGDVLGIWHTHPSNAAYPSKTDIRGWPKGLRYWIVTQDLAAEWKLHGDRIWRVRPQSGTSGKKK